MNGREEPAAADRFPGQQRIPLALIAVAATGLTYVGFRCFLFLTDDAFIAFRYISNHQLGRGFVWNPPPFLPVEGYTSWLWVAMLDQLWSWTGVEPPDAANLLSLAFGYATLALGCAFIARMELPEPLARHRTVLLALVLLGTVTNRTFLTWLSSGLETSLFNFCFLLWIYQALDSRSGSCGWLLRLGLSASLTALTRPDGMLVVAASVALVARHLWCTPFAPRRAARHLLAASPLLFTPLHLLWRRWFYGEWLPNTYYAKYTAPWPEAGWRYALSFVLEYAVWIWILVALALLLRRYRPGFAGWITGGTIAAHLAYYTLIIGGDHFEYRVYSHLVLPLFVSFVFFAARLRLPPRPALLLLCAFIVASWPLPWLHYLQSKDLSTRRETSGLFLPLAPSTPFPFRAYTRGFDTLQEWLIARSVCLRHQEHKVFQQFLADRLPAREEGLRIPWEGNPVLSATGVGMSGWILPNVAVIDVLGLNDYVTARSPAVQREQRVMAHDRRPPPGYVNCFRPNLALRLRREDLPENAPLIHLRPRRLSDDEIRRCEMEYRRRLREEPRATTN